MFEDYKYKIELHCHTAPLSACSDIPPAELIKVYREANYQGIVITNHFFPSEFKNQKKYLKYVKEFTENFEFLKSLGENAGIKVYFGVEIRFIENYNDYLLYGIDEDFLNNIPLGCKTLEEFSVYAKNFPDVLVIQAHPFRNGMLLKDSSLIDGMEVYNVHPNHNSRIGFAAKYSEMENLKVSTCGTDFHHVGQGALSAFLTKELPENEKELVKCMRENQVYKIGNSTVVF